MENTTENKYLGNPQQYRGLSYNTNINRDTRRSVEKYKKKIGYTLGGTIEGLLSRRNELVLMIANAGGGKTYVMLQKMAELSLKEENSNVRYVISVPNRNQSNQNERSNTLSRFKAKSIVGSKDGKRKIEVNAVTDKIFSCVYDKALEVVEILKSNGHEVVLVLDEAHKMIADANFRGSAIANLEQACKRADQTIMMTATPRTCLRYYKYTEILELVDEDANSNIEEFRVVLSDNTRLTLLKEIKDILQKTVTIVKEEERWEDTLEIVTPETLLEMLEGPKFETVKRKTETLITSEEVPAKVLVRLNSINQIDTYIAVLEKAGIKAEKLTRKEKDGEVFRSIEEQSKIITESRVIFCTSIVECGVSLENEDIYLIEMVRSAKDFNMDNTVQFFARPRKTINQGILIIPDAVNNRIKEEIRKEAKKAKENKTPYDELGELNRRCKNFTKVRDLVEAKAKPTYEKELERINKMFDIEANKALEDVNKFANMDLNTILDKVAYKKSREGEDVARQFLKDELVNQTYNNAHYKNVLEADLDALEVYIDTKKVVYKAFKELDASILRFHPEMLINYFEGKIFYDTIKMEHCNLAQMLMLNPELAKEYKDDVKFMQEIKQEQSEVKAMEEEKARNLLKDNHFVDLIPDIIEGNIYKETLAEYTLKYTIKDILSFKESSIFKQYNKLIKVFDRDTTVYLLTVPIIRGKAIDNRVGKYLKYVDSNITAKQFTDNMNIVPEKKEIRYLKGTELNDIIERKHIVENYNKSGYYKKNMNDKHSAILDVILPAKMKDGKQVAIRPSKDLLFKLNVELVNRRVYKDPDMEKAINAIKRNAEKNNLKVDLYSKTNIKKLEAVYSSNSEKNELKMLNEISKVFSLATDSRGYLKINSIIKTFDVANIVSQIK